MRDLGINPWALKWGMAGRPVANIAKNKSVVQKEEKKDPSDNFSIWFNNQKVFYSLVEIDFFFNKIQSKGKKGLDENKIKLKL